MSAVADDAGEIDVDSFDYVHLVIPDVNGLPRGQVIPRRFVRQKLEAGVELPYNVLMLGPNSEYSTKIEEYRTLENRMWKPDLSSLIATPWCDSGSRRTAFVLCDLLKRDGTPDGLSTRGIVQQLLRELRDKFGLTIKVAFEFEFIVMKEDTLEPLGGDSFQFEDIRRTEGHRDLLYDLCETLEKAGLYVTSITSEFFAGQWELNFDPIEGIKAADMAFHVKNAVKGFFKRRGYTATFMSVPDGKLGRSGLHLNHSLWTAAGQNAMVDDQRKDAISDLALRWNAGILKHARALTALCCPTINCYRRLNRVTCPSETTWAVEHRTGMTRFKVSNNNVYLESRLPSGAANPYLAIAGHLAAGMAGLEAAEIELPPEMDVEHAQKLPTSLGEALDCLEKDTVMVEALGRRFVSHLLIGKRDHELHQYSLLSPDTEEEKIKYERKKYLVSL
ncbi:lengsin-like [Pomacea canaliculata]|uniref:lengsin-like n=1 Tax=Pomacea canaliculata TaxID=400727 RepID=UPI000D73319D|nr:lengsin-like [Pomacea canaliculata]